MIGQSESSADCGVAADAAGIFSWLPVECISHAIGFTSPLDACRSAAVSKSFASASASDVVWRRFLPSDCESILARAVAAVGYPSKRELFFGLSDHPILIDDGNISFALDKFTGAKCFMLSARKISIIWSDHTQYWRWVRLADSRFAEVAELLSVWWLDISGKLESRMLSPRTSYVAFLVYKLSDEKYGLDYPQEATVKLGNHQATSMVQLQRREWQQRRRNPRHFFNIQGGDIHEGGVAPGSMAPKTRNDGWMEMELGDFYNEDGEDGEVDISLKEIKALNGKKGLLIQGIEIRSKH